MRARQRVAALLVLASAFARHHALAAETRIAIDNFTFTPELVTVAVGTQVVWTNHDDMPHTVTSDDNPAREHSPALDTDDHYARVFTEPGTYRYHCSLHPRMQGTIMVR